MTTSKSSSTNVVVVDGSNIATEGRSMPSLSQLNDAVMAFKEEHPEADITVVVDATFGHRIDKKESAEFDLAVAHNELVAPPAGAIGRGDAFVLSIANKVGARILSNDSFQEFHGDYPWLFDEGRLIGGKPVPYVGWVFVERLPVKGPISRKSQRAARGGGSRERGEPKTVRRSASREASQPMPVPTAPPPVSRRVDAEPTAANEPTPSASPPRSAAVPSAPAATGAPVNDLLPFLDFVEHHPVGSSVNGVVESYSSHGAYVTVGDLRGYVPLRLMSDPPPRSAREVMHVGESVTLVVISFAAARRSVDMAVPAMAPSAEVVPSPELDELVEAVAAPARRAKRTAKKVAPAEPPATAPDVVPDVADAVETVETVDAVPVKKRAPRKRTTKQAATPAPPDAVDVVVAVVAESPPAQVAADSPPEDAPVPAATPKKRAPRTAAAKSAAPVKRAAAKKAPAKKSAPSTEPASDGGPPPEVAPAGPASPAAAPSRSRRRAPAPAGDEAPAKRSRARARPVAEVS